MKTAVPLLLVSICALFAQGCVAHVPIPADENWHTILAVQSPTEVLELGLTNVSGKDAVPVKAPPATVSVRLIRVGEFSSYSSLPNTAEEAKKYYANTATPIHLLDTGPLDLTLAGTSRVVIVGSGWEVLARSNIPQTVISVRKKTMRPPANCNQKD